EKVMRKRSVFGDVAKKQLPLHFESIVEGDVVGHELPLFAKVKWVLHIRIPDGPGRVHAVLRATFVQAGYGTAEGAVHLDAAEFVPIDAERPRRIDLRDNTVFKLKCAVCGIVCGARIAPALLVDTLGNGGAAQALDGADRCKGVIEKITPVAKHIENDPAAIFRAVIPRGPLSGLPVAFEDPVTELAA